MRVIVIGAERDNGSFRSVDVRVGLGLVDVLSHWHARDIVLSCQSIVGTIDLIETHFGGCNCAEHHLRADRRIHLALCVRTRGDRFETEAGHRATDGSRDRFEVGVRVCKPRPVGFVECERDRRGRHAESRVRAQIVETELYVSLLQRNVGTALNVRGAPVRIVDRLTVHGDAHQVQRKRVLRAELARQSRDIHTFVIVEDGQLVIDDLDDDVRILALNEAGIDDIAGMHVTPTFGFDLLSVESHLLGDELHRSSSTRGRQADIVAVDHGRTPIESLVGRITDET